ncbi:MAG: hypothetical protein NDJ90_09690 [Oligoflexia bacterium]|nr:hypothetical protein [Oligoflexia bacterium]
MKNRQNRLAIQLLAAAFALHAGSARAGQFDYSFGAGARSLPLGATLIGDVGYNHILWGANNGRSPFFGYLRPAVKVQTSGVVNRGQVSLGVYPVSFWQLELGYAYSYRATTIDTLDCAVLECGGGLGRAFAGTSLVLARSGFFAGWSSTITALSPTRTEQAFGDESSSLAGAQGGDTLVSHEGFAGYELRPELRAGFLLSRDHMLSSGATSSLNSIFGRLDRGAWAFTLGAGIHESVTRDAGLAVFGMVRWKGAFDRR